MKYIYILLTCIVVYYLLTRVFEKYITLENFDPSLVPVSSIITLAKNSQKMLDGNGELTNLSLVQIGTPTALSNLTVSGSTVVNGVLTVNGSEAITDAGIPINMRIDQLLNVAGNTISNSLNTESADIGKSTSLKTLTVSNSLQTNYLDILGTTSIKTNSPGPALISNSMNINGTMYSPSGTLTVNGKFNTGTPTVSGNLTINKLIHPKSDVFYTGNYVTTNLPTGVTGGNPQIANDTNNYKALVLAGGNDKKEITLFGNVYLGDIDTGGDLSIGGVYNALPSKSIIMWWKSNPPPGWVICDGINQTKDKSFTSPLLTDRLISVTNSGTVKLHSQQTGHTYEGNSSHDTPFTVNKSTLRFIMKE
jgi:hypothetical protein